MEKILLGIDAVNMDMHALDFACYIARLTRSKLTGVFLENLEGYEKEVITDAFHNRYTDSSITQTYPDRSKIIENNITAFKEACQKRSVYCNIHRDRGEPANGIISESRYADLVILSATTTFNQNYEGAPTSFVKDVLSDSECPVIIAPEQFEEIEEIVFTTNFSKSSTFAIKQFTYLFPELSDKKVSILQVNKEGVWANGEMHNLGEWLQNRYSAVRFEVLQGKAEDELFDYLFNRNKLMVVMGAYGRNSLSRFFKRSHADVLIKVVSQPIFITHR